MIDTVVSKYGGHLPLYRQSAILERETGLEISRATLDGWVMRVGELLRPIAAVIGRELIGGSYIQADETPVDVQMHDGRGQNHHAYLWQYGRPEGSVVFDFRLGRGREGPKLFLGGFEGLLRTDGHAAYEKVGGPKMVHASRSAWMSKWLRTASVQSLSCGSADSEHMAENGSLSRRNNYPWLAC